MNPNRCHHSLYQTLSTEHYYIFFSPPNICHIFALKSTFGLIKSVVQFFKLLSYILVSEKRYKIVESNTFSLHLETK